jgi:hypothetical protein
MKKFRKRLYRWLKRALRKATFPRYYHLSQAYTNLKETEECVLPKKIDLKNYSDLCHIMYEHGSDKGKYIGMGRHNYTFVYHALFNALREESFNLFEMGIGTNDVTFTSNMGIDGTPGASLRGWREYFPYAKIYAADIDAKVLVNQPSISSFYCDQTDPQSILSMWNNLERDLEFKVIIDDGLHEFDANVCFLENAWEKLEQGGIYVVEDILNTELGRWKKYLENLQLAGSFTFFLIELPNVHNVFDNNLMVLHKKPN